MTNIEKKQHRRSGADKAVEGPCKLTSDLNVWSEKNKRIEARESENYYWITPVVRLYYTEGWYVDTEAEVRRG